MNAGSYQSVKVSEIHLRDDVIKRTVSEEGVAKLVASMAVSGLQSAIRVRPLTIYKSGQPFQEWELVAGRHRLEAARKLAWIEIDANVTYLSDNMAELAMIDENMARTDLQPAEFVYATARRKVLYEVEFSETKNGGDRRSDRHNGELIGDKTDRFTKTASKLSGKGERTIQRAATAGKAIGSIAPRLVGTSLNSITELEALARLAPEPRNALIKRAIAGEQVSAKAERPRRERISNRTRQVSDNDNTPSTSLPMMDLTTAEHEEVVMAVGEAAAEASFFREPIAQNTQKDHQREKSESDITLSSPIADIARAANVDAVSGARSALDEFLGRFAGLTADQRHQCLSGRDLSEVFDAYTN